MTIKKKNKKKNLGFFAKNKDNNKIYVRAKTPEKAAKKIYRMFKKKYFEIGYVRIFSENEENEWVFPCNLWLGNNGCKFNSKPK